MPDPLETHLAPVEAGPPVDSIPPTFAGPLPARDPDESTLPDAVPVPSAPALAIPGYEIHEILGRGGMGIVYRARQTALRRDVAIKTIRSGAAADADEQSRFRREAEAIGRLQHPHVVAIFDVGTCDGRPFFSMEYCPGGSLAQWRRSHTPSLDEAVRLFAKIAAGVAALHGLGIVHRDLKPQNVLLAADGEPKVSDFGLAKLASESRLEGAESTLTQTGALLGTPAYMAPEQALGEAKRVGPPADVHALGAILYELLVGAPPFRGTGAIEVVRSVLEDEPIPPRRFRPEIPRDLELLCLKCLEKSPERRYPSARELVDDLARFQTGETLSIVRAGVFDRVAGAYERVRLQERFAGYGTLMLVLSPIMLLAQVHVSLVVWNDWSPAHLTAAQTFWVAAFFGVVAAFRGGRLRPDGVFERHLWTVWGGYVLACALGAVAARAAANDFGTRFERTLYVPWSAATALAFFSIASWFWGRAIYVGAIFLLLPFVMALDLEWAPLEFGAVWATVFAGLGLRLRRLARSGSDN
jgi:tRNA A-37 threonylcarbamoyl transferase component Bud32